MTTIGRYSVIRELGHGGMGQVFLAHDPTLERDVALKLLQRDPTGAGLRDEAKALAALSHPGIVTIYEIGEHDGRDFIAMEYLSGKTLRELMVTRASRDALLVICAKVARAMAAAHRAGILHRDVKPENVVVTDDGAVKVVDFGIARRLTGAVPRQTVNAQDVVDVLTRPGDTAISAGTQTMFGTPAYIAPEVLLGEPSSAASDIYSLGIVVYECLAKRRPHDGQLVEVIAQVIEGPAPSLDDPLGELVGSMLARDPAKRPPLDEIGLALVARDATPRKTPRWPLAALAAVAAVAVGGVAWELTRGEASPPPPPATPPPARPVVTASIAIAPFALSIPSYGSEPPKPDVFADTLARLLGEVDGAKLGGVVLTGDDARGAARAAAASYLVTGSIDERGAELLANLDLYTVPAGDHVASIKVAKPVGQPARLIATVAAEIARAVAPGATLAAAPSRMRAQLFYAQGKPFLDHGRFTDARPYFEQAVDADPSMFEAWYGLTLVLSWMGAPDERVVAASERAIALAPPGPRKDLVRGVSLFLAGDNAKARELLEPLESADLGPDAPDRREVLYYLGEAYWHDGLFGKGFACFKRVLAGDPHFGAATVHAWQYAVARRSADAARYYLGLGTVSQSWVEMSLGRYKELAGAPAPSAMRMWAQIVVDRGSPDLDRKLADDDLEAWTYKVAIAGGRGDLATARAEFAEMWQKKIAPLDADRLPAATFAELESIGEVVLAAGMTDELRLLVEFYAAHAHGHVRHGGQRLAILAAIELSDDKLIPTGELSARNTKLAAAATAALHRDRAKAATILAEVVADPSFNWDYAERAELLRLGHHHAALCADTMRPAVFRPAFIVLRHLCAR